AKQAVKGRAFRAPAHQGGSRHRGLLVACATSLRSHAAHRVRELWWRRRLDPAVAVGARPAFASGTAREHYNRSLAVTPAGRSPRIHSPGARELPADA